MTDEGRKLEFEIEVDGTPEEVWAAIATGRGISSWYVPHEFDEREGGTGVARFGPGPEMEAPGRIRTWDPPNRIVFDGGDEEGMAFEWLVEARDGGSCVVRLVNSGFGSGEEWDAQYDGMKKGWQLFLLNLRLHLEHFRGQWATAALPTAMLESTQLEAFAKLAGDLGIDPNPAVGDQVTLQPEPGLTLRGTVVETEPWRIAMLVDAPVSGTAFIASEGMGEHVSLSVWFYLYGEEGAAAVARDESRWAAWLATLNG